MLTRRDKLLIRPWQQRKYENHRRKVQSALPAIDNRPPPSREHVAVKLKKQQKENERIMKIENENFMLLRKMSYIMRTSRVDNNWMLPLPNFLRRVEICHSSKVRDIYIDEIIATPKRERIRAARCVACTPQKTPDPQIPEDRVPWEPEKPPVSRRRAQSVPARKSSLPTIIEKEAEPAKAPAAKQKSAEGTRSAKRRERDSEKANRINFEGSLRSPQSIILSTGCLQLAVNFPADTLVKLQEGKSERLLFGGECYCKSIMKVF